MGEKLIKTLMLCVALTVAACGTSGGDAGAGVVDAVPGQRALPGAPTITRVVSGDGHAVVHWNPPGPGGGAVTRYIVTGDPDGSRSVAGGETSARVGGLTNGQEYSFTVRAASDSGFGPDSDPSARVLVATVPGAPPALGAARSGESDVRLGWLAPLRDGGAPVTSYIVDSATASPPVVLAGSVETGYRPVGVAGAVLTPGESGDGSQAFVLLLDAAAGGDRFRVAAGNTRGVGPWSAWATVPAPSVPDSGDGVSIVSSSAAPPEAQPEEQAGSESASTDTAGTPTPTPAPPGGKPTPTAAPEPTPVVNLPGATITVEWLPTLYGEDGPPPGWRPSLVGNPGEPFLLHSIEAWSTDPVDVFRGDISWGDGTTDQAWFEDPVYISSRTADGVAKLFAYHTYDEPGIYPITVTVSAINHSGVVGETVVEALIGQ